MFTTRKGTSTSRGKKPYREKSKKVARRIRYRKNNHGLSRAMYRGNPAVHIKALMTACARNVCQLVKHLKTLMKHPQALANLRGEEPRMCLVW
ncbi:MAG: transposase [Clostridia bacterium]|nr:transposase [Clostridia bacterium]